MPQTVNIAIIGTGMAAEYSHGPAFAQVPGAVLWSVCSRKRDKAARFASKFSAASGTPAYDNLTKLLVDPALDAVLIATPDAYHAGAAVLAAQAGKHVFCEKPLATSREEAETMLDACVRNNVKLAVGYHHRFHAGHRIVSTMLRQRLIGEVRHMRVQWTYAAKNSANWRTQREYSRWWALAGPGTHAIDMVRWWMGSEPDQVRALSSRPVWKGPHEETASIALRFENGATADILCSTIFESPRRIEVYGTEGSILCEDTLGPHGEGSIVAAGERLAWSVSNPYAEQLNDFVGSIVQRRDPEVSGEDGLRNLEIMIHAAGPPSEKREPKKTTRLNRA